MGKDITDIRTYGNPSVVYRGPVESLTQEITEGERAETAQQHLVWGDCFWPTEEEDENS